MEPNFAQEIRKTDARIVEIDVEVRDRYREIGRIVVTEKLEIPEALDSIERYYGLQSEIATLAGEIESIVTVESQIGELRAAGTALQDERKKVSATMDPLFREIGRIGFSLFREHPLIDSRFSVAFEEVSRYYDEIESLQTEQERIESGKQSTGVFGKAVLEGRNLMIRSRKAGKENRLFRLYEEAGRRLVASGFIDQIDDPSFNDAAAPYLAVVDQLETIDKRELERREELKSAENELETLCDGKRPNRRRADIERTIEERQRTLANAIADVGTRAATTSHDAFRSEADRISTLEKERNKLRKTRTRLEAAVAVQELSEKISSAERKRTDLQKRIEDLETELEEQGAAIETLIAERTSMEKTRGSVGTLVQADE